MASALCALCIVYVGRGEYAGLRTTSTARLAHVHLWAWAWRGGVEAFEAAGIGNMEGGEMRDVGLFVDMEMERGIGDVHC